MMDASPRSTNATSTGRLVDVGWCIFVVAVTAGAVAHGHHVALQVAAGVTAFCLVLARRRWPVPSLVIGLLAAFVSVALAKNPTALLPVVVLLIFHVARFTDRAGATWAGLSGLVVLTGSVLTVLGPKEAINGALFAALSWPTLAAAAGAAGDAVRSRAEVIAAAIERAERAERERDENARRRVIEERLRIARDLHDVVAHNIAVVNVQAGVASHLLPTDPDAARTALGHVRSATQLVLEELANILGVLRSDNDASAPTDPTPTLADVPALIDQVANAELAVTYRTSGEPHPLPRAASVAAYRVIQEALTNAQKHGDGQAAVDVDFTPEHLHVSVTNHASETSAAVGSGFGLIGMRERVTAAGGTLHTGREQSGLFVVEATFPLEARVIGEPS